MLSKIPSRLRRARLVALFIALALAFASVGSHAATAQAKTVVTLWTWNPAGFDTPAGQPPQAEKVAFDAANPDIDLQVKVYSYQDYLNQLQLNMAAGTGPDIVDLQDGALLNTYKEFLVDLGPLSQKTWGANWADRFLSLGLDQTRIGSTVPGLPLMDSAAGWLWYNKTLFDKYNLKPPTTWDEWISVSKALTADGVTGFFQGAQDQWVNLDMYIALANQLAPGKVYQAEAGTVKWTDPGLVKAMDYWRQMFSNGIMQKGALANTQYPDTHQAFMSGKTGMMLMGVWNNFAALTKTGVAANQKSYGFTDTFEYGTVLFPDITGSGHPGKPFGGPDVVVSINKSSQVQDAAWKVVSWMMGTDSQKLQAKQLNVPSIKGVPFDTSDATGDFAKQILNVQITQLGDSSGKRNFRYPEINTALGDAMQAVATGQQTPADAMAAVQAASDKIKRDAPAATTAAATQSATTSATMAVTAAQ